MAALVCDICGGKLVMGSGGIAVCDSCGMEYSTERIREKVQSIKGIVQIDNSNMVGTWMKMAISAAEAGNQKEAYDYYAKILEVEPSNWRAIFGKGKAAAWQSTLANPRTSELYQAVKMSVDIIENSGMTPEEIANLKNEFAVAIYNVNNAFLELRKENFDRHDDKYYDLHWDEWWEAHYVQGTENIRQTEDVMSLIENLDDDLSKSNVFEMKKHICEVLVYVCDCSDTYWNSYSQNYLQCFGISEVSKKPFIEKYVKLVTEIRETEPDFRTSKYSQIDPWNPAVRWDSKRYDKLLSYWQKKDQEMKVIREKELAKKRYAEYWQEHAEDKKQYEARIAEIDDKINHLREQFDQYDIRIFEIEADLVQSVPAETQLDEIKKQQSELISQKTTLGLFAGKQKKQLQDQIDTLQSQINDVETTVKRQKKSIQDDVSSRVSVIEAERKPFMDQISVLEEEKNRIKTELTKER